MTLAEVFLLLMFIVWLGVTAEAKGSNTVSVPRRVLEEENARLAKVNDELEQSNADLKVRLQQLRDMLGADAEDFDSLQKGFKERMAEARRGHPKCHVQNTIAEVVVVDGVHRVTALPSAADVLSLKAQGQLTTAEETGRFLRAVAAHNSLHRCRFDYRLRFKTKADYYDARERYEQAGYFYMASREQIQ